LAVLEGGARLPAHAAFETYSVLSRLPPPVRATPQDVIRFLRSWFESPYPTLAPGALAELLHGLPALHISGGATYDALIAAVAAADRAPLATCDRRALVTYRRFGVTLEVIG
jgi:hypothetical protein